MYRPTNTSKKSGGHITHVVLDFTQDTVGEKKYFPGNYIFLWAWCSVLWDTSWFPWTPSCWEFRFSVSRTPSPHPPSQVEGPEFLIPCTGEKASSRGAWWCYRLSSSHDCWVRTSPASRYPRWPDRSQRRIRYSALRGEGSVTWLAAGIGQASTCLWGNTWGPAVVWIFAFSLVKKKKKKKNISLNVI